MEVILNKTSPVFTLFQDLVAEDLFIPMDRIYFPSRSARVLKRDILAVFQTKHCDTKLPNISVIQEMLPIPVTQCLAIFKDGISFINRFIAALPIPHYRVI